LFDMANSGALLPGFPFLMFITATFVLFSSMKMIS
jgi:hypothetical protein